MYIEWWRPTDQGFLNVDDADGSKLAALSSMNHSRLGRIKYFIIHFQDPAARPSKETWHKFVEKTPNLESLTLRSRYIQDAHRWDLDGQWEDQVLSDFFDALQQPSGCPSCNSLKDLDIRFNVNNYNSHRHVAITKRLFLEILPLFPNLRSLIIPRTYLNHRHIIPIATAIAEREPQNTTCCNPRLISIEYNHVGYKSTSFPEPSEADLWKKPKKKETADELQKALLILLRSAAFPVLFHIGKGALLSDEASMRKSRLPPREERLIDFEGQLFVNHAGRRRFHSAPGMMIPKNLWPIILKRAYSGSFRVYGRYCFRGEEPQMDFLRNATGVYDLLRNCSPILQHLVENCSEICRNKGMKELNESILKARNVAKAQSIMLFKFHTGP